MGGYLGIPDVRFDAKVGDWIHLATFTSTSDNLQVAESFADDIGGVLLEFENIAAAPDVSWMYVSDVKL